MHCDPCPGLMHQLRVQIVRATIPSAKYPLPLHTAGSGWLQVGEMAAAAEAAVAVLAPAADIDRSLVQQI
jgi:hypothetical protein